MTSVVQTQDAAGAGSPTTLNFTNNVAVGNSVVVWIGDYNTSSSVISSSAPTYNGSSVAGATKLWEAQNVGTDVMYSACWLLPDVASSGKSVAISTTNANADTNTHYFIAEVAGLGASPAIDAASPNPATANSNGSANPSSGATGNAVASSGIAIGGNMVDASHGQTVGGAWTTIGTQSGFYPAAGYQIFTSSGTSYTFSSTLATGQWSAGVIILDVTASAGGGNAAPPSPPGRLSPPTIGLPAVPVQAPQSPPTGQATPYPLTPPGLQSPMSLGVPLSSPTSAPPTGPLTPPVPYVPGTQTPLTPPGLQSPMSLGVPLTAPSPAPQTPPTGQATPTPLVPPGRLSPMSLSAYLPPGSPAPAPPPPVVIAVGAGFAPVSAPGRLSPMSLGVPLTAPSPAPQTPPVTPPVTPPPVPGGGKSMLARRMRWADL